MADPWPPINDIAEELAEARDSLSTAVNAAICCSNEISFEEVSELEGILMQLSQFIDRSGLRVVSLAGAEQPAEAL